MITLEAMRRFAVARSLFEPLSLKRALHKMGFVQADPIRAPARAQDLTLRHRVKDYRAGDLERHYAKLGVAEDFFINYGFVTHEIQALMHPRRRALASAMGRSPIHGEARDGPQNERSSRSSCWSSSRTRRGASARGRRAFRARQRDELLGRFI